MTIEQAPPIASARAASAAIVALVGALLATWLGVNAVWGLTGEELTLVSAWQVRVMPLSNWLAAGVFVVAIGAATARARAKLPLAEALAMLLAYLVGVALSRWLHTLAQPPFGAPLRDALDPLRWAYQRSFLLMPCVPMLAVYLWSNRTDYPLRWGDWSASAPSADHGPGRSWGRRMLAWVLLIGLPYTLIAQAGVDFAPLLSGRVVVFFVPLVLLALLNGFTEELLFRGLLMPPMIKAAGVTAGVSMQAALFGFHHWGASPDPIAGLPTAIVLVGLGYFLGVTVLRTRGLAWAVCAHAVLDFPLFASQFVAVS